MPDFHQPDDTDRAEAERTGAADAGIPEDPAVRRLRETRPSSKRDPNRPDRPKT